MIFELLKKEDNNQIVKLIKDCFNIDSDINNLESLNNSSFVVLKDNNIVVATSMITTIYDPFKNLKKAYIDYFCVNPSYQGKGIGNIFFDKIEEYLRNEDYNIIELTSRKERVNARSLYTSKGMSLIDTDVFRKEI